MCLDFACNVAMCGASNQTHERACIDMLDFGPPDYDQQYTRKSPPSISLVRSNGQNFILQ